MIRRFTAHFRPRWVQTWIALWLGVAVIAPRLMGGEAPPPEPVDPDGDPAPVLPDALPPGEAAPWEPAATPPADNEPPRPLVPVITAGGSAPGSTAAPAPGPATGNGPGNGDGLGAADENPVNTPLDFQFLDFLVPKHPRPTWRFGAAFDIAGTAEIDETRATVGTQSLEGFVGYKEWRVRYKRNFFDWDLHGEGVFPSFPTAAGGGLRDPWQDLQTLGIAWFRFGRWKPKWMYIVSAGVNATWEAEMKDCFAAYALGSLVYAPDANWKFNFGVMLAVNRVHILPLPMVGFSYRKDSPTGWFVQIGFPELLVGYRFNEKFMLSTKFIEGEGETWRLSDHNPVAHGGYLETKGARTGLDGEWKPREDLTVNFGLKYAFSRQWTVRSSTLKHKETINLDNALNLHCQFEYAF